MNKITIEHIESKIKKVEFYRWPETTLTVCNITLQNGYSVRGESACVDPTNYNQELGEKFAREDAVKKIWALEGYLLKERIYQESK